MLVSEESRARNKGEKDGGEERNLFHFIESILSCFS